MGEYENVTLDLLYKKLQSIEDEVKEINADLHRVKPSFVEKLKKSEKGKIHKFGSLDELEKAMDKQ